MSLLFNMLSRLVIAFHPRSKCLLISWLQSSSTVILEPKKIESMTAYTFSPSICREVMGSDAVILVFWMLSFKSICYCRPSPSSRDASVTLLFLPLEWYHLHMWGCWYFSWQSWFQLVIHPTQHFTWCVMYSTYNVNKQSDSIQPWGTTFPILNLFVVPCPVLTVASWPACRFLMRQARCSSILSI